MFAVLPCEEDSPALSLASLAEVCSCSLRSGRAVEASARSMSLQARLLAFLWWSAGNGVIPQSLNQFPVPILHGIHHVVRLFVHGAQHAVVEKLHDADSLRDTWFLPLLHMIQL